MKTTASHIVDDINKSIRIANKAREFVHEPETWESYEELKTSTSAATPPEFMALCEIVEEVFGPPPAFLGDPLKEE